MAVYRDPTNFFLGTDFASLFIADRHEKRRYLKRGKECVWVGEQLDYNKWLLMSAMYSKCIATHNKSRDPPGQWLIPIQTRNGQFLHCVPTSQPNVPAAAIAWSSVERSWRSRAISLLYDRNLSFSSSSFIVLKTSSPFLTIYSLVGNIPIFFYKHFSINQFDKKQISFSLLSTLPIKHAWIHKFSQIKLMHYDTPCSSHYGSTSGMACLRKPKIVVLEIQQTHKKRNYKPIVMHKLVYPNYMRAYSHCHVQTW